MPAPTIRFLRRLKTTLEEQKNTDFAGIVRVIDNALRESNAHPQNRRNLREALELLVEQLAQIQISDLGLKTTITTTQSWLQMEIALMEFNKSLTAYERSLSGNDDDDDNEDYYSYDDYAAYPPIDKPLWLGAGNNAYHQLTDRSRSLADDTDPAVIAHLTKLITCTSQVFQHSGESKSIEALHEHEAFISAQGSNIKACIGGIVGLSLLAQEAGEIKVAQLEAQLAAVNKRMEEEIEEDIEFNVLINTKKRLLLEIALLKFHKVLEEHDSQQEGILGHDLYAAGHAAYNNFAYVGRLFVKTSLFNQPTARLEDVALFVDVIDKTSNVIQHPGDLRHTKALIDAYDRVSLSKIANKREIGVGIILLIAGIGILAAGATGGISAAIAISVAFILMSPAVAAKTPISFWNAKRKVVKHSKAISTAKQSISEQQLDSDGDAPSADNDFRRLL